MFSQFFPGETGTFSFTETSTFSSGSTTTKTYAVGAGWTSGFVFVKDARPYVADRTQEGCLIMLRTSSSSAVAISQFYAQQTPGNSYLYEMIRPMFNNRGTDAAISDYIFGGTGNALDGYGRSLRIVDAWIDGSNISLSFQNFSASNQTVNIAIRARLFKTKER